jgi:hypothetical protein
MWPVSQWLVGHLVHRHVTVIRIQDRIWTSITTFRTILVHFLSLGTVSNIACDFQDCWCISLRGRRASGQRKVLFLCIILNLFS